MNFNDIENWFKSNKITSTLLTFLFLTGLVFQTTDTFKRIGSYFFKTEKQYHGYNILTFPDIGFIKTDLFVEESSYLSLEDSSIVFPIKLKTKNDLIDFEALKEAENEIFLVALSATDEYQEEGINSCISPDAYDTNSNAQLDSSMLRFELGEYFQIIIENSDELSDNVSGSIKTIQIDFPAIGSLGEWGNFDRSVATASQGYSKYKEFYRLVSYSPSHDFGHQLFYKAIPVKPDPNLAKISLERLKDIWSENDIFTADNDLEFIDVISEQCE